MDKMKALVLVEPGQTEIREIDRPIPGAGEALLQISWVGFCGGDLNGYRGLFELQEYPNVLGHEVGATIVEVGAQVPDEFMPGMNVTIDPYQHCGVCVSCRKGRTKCLSGQQNDGRSPTGGHD